MFQMSVTFPRDREAARDARHDAVEALERVLRPDGATRARLLLAEAVSHQIVAGQTDAIRLEVRCAGGRVLASVRDAGAERPDHPVGPLPPLHLVPRMSRDHGRFRGRRAGVWFDIDT
jgi:anti-sigma regulatory factor (Ser/Thr protein kinase)